MRGDAERADTLQQFEARLKALQEDVLQKTENTVTESLQEGKADKTETEEMRTSSLPCRDLGS